MSRTKREALIEAQSYGMLSGVINTPEDLVNDPVFRGRGVFEEIEHPVAGAFEYPGRPLVMGETPRQQPRRAPMLGEHNAEVLTELLGLTADDLPLLKGVGAI